MIVAGIDMGSLTTKAAIVEDFDLISHSIGRSGVNVVEIARHVMNEALGKVGLSSQDVERIVATGYGRISLPFAHRTITEITCNARGLHQQFPDSKIIIDIGGQDTKVIRLGPDGTVENFTMNDKCAAGTGRFLEVAAQTLEVDIDALAELSSQSRNTIEISSTCTVFAQTEIVSMMARQTPREDIIAALHVSIARRVFGLFCSLRTEGPIVMTGGVAKNSGVVRALENLIKRRLFIPENPQIWTAFGAALFGEKKQ